MLQNCLLFILGTVRRSTDGDFIHANVDIDLIIDEEAEVGSLDKPVEMFHIVEHFCLGGSREASCANALQIVWWHMLFIFQVKDACKYLDATLPSGRAG